MNAQGGKVRALIVDDKEENRYLLEAVLRGGGYETVSAADGLEALRKLKREDVDIIVSDILMPGMDGFQLCREVKADDRLKDMPFVFLTAAYTDSKDEKFALSLGADSFLVKPVDPASFLEEMSRLTSAGTSAPAAGRADAAESEDYLKAYSERLAGQLEKKMVEVEAANHDLTERVRELNCLHGISSLGHRPGTLMEEVFRDAVEIIPQAWRYAGEACARIVFDGQEFASAGWKETGWVQQASIRVDGRVKGTVTVAYTGEKPAADEGPFTADQRRLLESVASQLGQVAERDSLEAQFRQAQKMEAIGRLAGGVAHDFNNLLTAIICNAELSLLGVDTESNEERIKVIMETAERASRLTRQLLAFSRTSILEPVELDLNQIVAEMQKMLLRLLGENIEYSASLGKEMGRIKADPSQLEQVVLNLVVNARDAMPDGGRISVKTERVTLDEELCRHAEGLQPGDGAVLTVADTGQGMPPEVKEHIFEPFFTTKETGTGLGLSTVYGIITQLGGYIEVLSEEGEGTSFRIYLSLLEKPEETEEAAADTGGGLLRGVETVLVVEDDETLRNLIVGLLRGLGYKVIMATSGEGLFHRLASHDGPIDMLVTDVVLPDIRGPEVYRQLSKRYGGLKVLYMSGYPGSEIGAGEASPFNEGNFMAKPFSAMDLARKIRSVLDE